MALDRAELDRLADDTYKNRVITGFIYCGNCGYNLHSLPYVYTCPECGNAYNARPLSMKGIFTPHAAHLPMSEIAGTLVSLLVAGPLIWSGVTNKSPWNLGSGIAIGALAIVLAYKGYRHILRYLKCVEIARRIAAQESG